MWFKNLNIFRINKDAFTEEELISSLSNFKYSPCSPHEEIKSGWVSPFGGHSDYLCPGSMGCFLICLKIETRKVPNEHIKLELEEEIKELKKQNPDIKINGALKKELKEKIKEKLMPRAFSSVSNIYAYIDTRTNFLYIDVSSESKACAFISTLISTFSDRKLSICPVKTKSEASFVMKNWILENEVPSKITLGKKVSISGNADYDDGGTIKYAKHDLYDEKLKGYLEDGKVISDLQVIYDEKINITITDDFLIKSIKWLDDVKLEAESVQEDDSDASLMSTFTIAHNSIKDMTEYLINVCFDGESDDDDDDEG